jgi:hypothetical protein
MTDFTSHPPLSTENPAAPNLDGGVPIFIPPEDQQQEIVSICKNLKTIWKTHAGEKKLAMQRAYAYAHSQFFDDTDLLPRPASPMTRIIFASGAKPPVLHRWKMT